MSLGAWVSESLSTRLDSVRAPDLLCVDEERLDPDARLRELALERLFDADERLLDLDEELLEPPERVLLLDRELRWGILPFLLLDGPFNPVMRGYPIPTIQTLNLGRQFKFHLSG